MYVVSRKCVPQYVLSFCIGCNLGKLASLGKSSNVAHLQLAVVNMAFGVGVGLPS